jgi:hypothetical protein
MQGRVPGSRPWTSFPALRRRWCTHYFRDHSAGAVRAAAAGIPIFVPERELALFTDPDEHFRTRPNYDVYDNSWEHFAPIEAISVTGVLRDEERIERVADGRPFGQIAEALVTVDQP